MLQRARALRNICVTSITVMMVSSCVDTKSVTGPANLPRASAASAGENGTNGANGNSPELNTRHEFHTRDFYAKTSNARPTNSGISYHGGTVIAGTATKIVAIYWGTGTIYASQATGSGLGNADPTLIGSFLRSLGGSPYFNINTTYYNASNVRVLNQVAYTSFWTTGSDVAAPSLSPTDANMTNLIQQGLTLGKIAYDPNTVYAIFTGPGINLGGGFGSQYCAYHTHATTSKGVVYYAAMPYNQDFASGCTSQLGSPNADVAANSEVNTLAHEIEETTTDAMGNAWYDSRGYENADKCAWTWGTTFSANGGVANMTLADGKSYLIQRNWVNAGAGGCALSY